jgi:hypothetical protein
MKINVILITVFIILSVNVSAEICEIPSELKATPAPKPAVPVSPVYPKDLFIKEIKGCAIISFILIDILEKQGSGLIPSEIKIVQASNPEFGEAAMRSVSKWLYLFSNAKKDTLYVSEINFDSPAYKP